MARQGINTGTTPNDGLGDSLLAGAIKINSNFSEIYNTFGDGNTLVSYANTAGISTYSVTSGYAITSGIATVAQGLTGTPSIDVYRLGITSSINVGAASTFQKSVHFESTLLIGDTDELQIFHDGNNSYIDNASAGNLILRDSGLGIQLKKSTGALMGVFNIDAGVELYYDSVLKLQTFQNGVAINDSVGIGSTAGNPPYRLTVSGVGATITQGLANAIADFTSSVNGYGQLNVRNSLSGTNASGDIVVTANTGNDISNFIDLGINNTGFTTTSWTINGPLDGYLYTSDGNLSIGAAAANKYLSLFAGGTLTSNEQVRVTTTGVGIGTTNATSKLTVSGDVRVSGVSTFAGITTVTGATLFAEQLSVSGIITGSSFRPSGGYYQSANGANAFYVYDTSGNVAFQGTIGVNQINSGSGYKALEFSAQTTPVVMVTNGLNVTGVTTSSGGFVGNLTGTATTATTSGYATTAGIATYASTAGISTTSQGLTGTPNLNIGVVTATSFFGDGSNIFGLQTKNLGSYSSSSDISNSATSISGISTYSEIQYLNGSFATNSGDNFGYSVATSSDGNTLVVGAIFDEITGSTGPGVVYVFDRVGAAGTFVQVGVITGIYANNANDYYGVSLATSADGKTIIVGALIDEIPGGSNTGVVYVYDRVGVGTTSTFNQVGILTGSLASSSNDFFGTSVATSSDGKTIVVGAYFDEGTTGRTYVFNRDGNTFRETAVLSESGSSYFGYSVATSSDGKSILVGSYNNNAGAGNAYVYDKVGIGVSYRRVGILTGSYASDTGDNFGFSVDMSSDGRTMVVGARGDEIPGGLDTGVVYVYDRLGNTFTQVGILTGSYASSGSDNFGTSVACSADGKTIVVGATGDEINNDGTGVVYVFNRIGNTFTEVSSFVGSQSIESSDSFGFSLDISSDGKTIFVGAYDDENISFGSGSGLVYVYDQVRSSYLFSTPSGNIGIGTSNATSKLTVSGNALITGVTTITGNLNALGNSYVKLARTSNQTVTNGTDTLIGFSVISDPNNWYSGITTRTTPTVAGTYRVDVMINWQNGSVANNQTNIQLRKNGNTFALSQVGIQTNFAYTQTACGIVTMNGTTDYIDFTVYTANPTSQVVTGTADGAWTKMEIFKIN